ncbi:hypothetical protein [Halobellus litoreus]|uniref:Uncharacterized protein n=1 Tax=Halobellus litoreus TaxID=755310 RepID=A0ABD6DZD4_9EURY|nr:hypothetical protein [Halobellus litoreus]
MSAIPADIETDAQPPMAIPLRHFLVGLAFLLAGTLLGTLSPLGVLPGATGLAHVHLLLVGWVCITIMGAMTQFVPVWSGTALHSRRLSTIQLWTVTGGLAGFVLCLLGGFYGVLPAFGVLILAGFWVFVYNVGRTLLGVRPWDVTERHFAVALGFFLLVTFFGLLLAVGYARPLFVESPLTRSALRSSHATLAVFGAVLTTVFGALYQLGTMFTQTELHGVDIHLRRIEELGYPFGVVALAGGRLFADPTVARIGGLLVLAGVGAMGLILGRRLVETAVAWNPMLRRYAVAAGAMVGWALVTLPVWLSSPLDPTATFGSPAGTHLLLLGAVGFVVAGTLYHVVPFIVWVHRYSDRLGLEAVPMIDDLYDDRLARIDFAAMGIGAALLVGSESAQVLRIGAPTVGSDSTLLVLGGAASVAGVAVLAVNLAMTVRRHGDRSLFSIGTAGDGSARDPVAGDSRTGDSPAGSPPEEFD